MNKKLLGIYLNDHLAGATAGHELAKRTAKSNDGTGFGAPLQEICEEIASDRQALAKIMGDLGISEDVLKQKAAFVGEKLGRLKLNGQLTGYSPLSRVVEIEALALGTSGKLALWRSLQHVDGVTSDVEGLIRRAEDQIDRLEKLRLEAVTKAWASPEDTPSL